MNKFCVLGLFIFTFVEGLAAEEVAHKIHIVIKNTSISKVAFEYCRKVYGPKGFIAQIKKINPDLSDNLHSGMEIKIPLDPTLCLLPHNPVTSMPEDYKEANNSKTNNVNKNVSAQDQSLTKAPSTVKVKTKPETAVKKASHINNSDGDLVVSDPYFVNRWLLTILTGSKTLESTDDEGDKALVNSKNFLDLELANEFSWSDKHRSSIFVSLGYEDYFETNTTVDSASPLRYGFGLEHSYKPERLIFSLDASFSQRTILRSSTSDEIRLMMVNVPAFGAGVKMPFQISPRYRASAGIKGRFLLPTQNSSIRMRNGVEGRVFLELQHGRASWNIFYQYTKQDSNLYKNSYDIIGLSFRWDLTGWK